HGAHTVDRRVTVVDGAIGDNRRNLRRHAVPLVALVHHHHTACLPGGGDQCAAVERGGGTWIDHFGADAGRVQHLRHVKSDAHHPARGHDRDVRTGALDVGDVEGHLVLFVCQRIVLG